MMTCFRRAGLCLVLGGLAVWGAAPALAADDQPAWVRARIAGYPSLPLERVPIAIWQITHQGRPAYLFLQPCCDQHNPLYSAEGRLLCAPSGGMLGRGDGRCPQPADPGTPVRLVWVDPRSPLQAPAAPALGQ